MKKTYLTLILLLTFNQLHAQIIEFNDPGFKAVLLTTLCSDPDEDGIAELTADINGDGEIDVVEAGLVIDLVINDNFEVNSLSDIVHFPNLLSFSNRWYSKPPKNVDFSSNQKLKTLDIHFDGARFDISNLGALEHCNLYVTENVKGIFVNENIKLDTLEIFNAIWTEETLHIDSVDVSNNKLISFKIDFVWERNETMYFNASNNELEEIDLNRINPFRDAQTTNTGKLDYFDIGNNNLTGPISIGSVDYVNVKTVKNNDIEIYPNPAKGYFSIKGNFQFPHF